MALADGLVGYWSPWLGSSGYTLLDRTRYANHGTLTNMDAGTDWVGATIQGRSGFALDFDGTNDHVKFSKLPYLDGKSRISFSWWANWALNSSNQAGFFSYGTLNQFTNDIFVFYSGGKYNIQINNGTDGANTHTDSVPTTWTHYSVTFDSGNVAFYINGTQKTLSGSYTYPSSTSSVSTHAFAIGQYIPSVSGWYLNGKVADCAVWDRVVSAEEVLQLYRLGPGWYRAYAKRSIGYAAAQFNRRRRILCGDYN